MLRKILKIIDDQETENDSDNSELLKMIAKLMEPVMKQIDEIKIALQGVLNKARNPTVQVIQTPIPNNDNIQQRPDDSLSGIAITSVKQKATEVLMIKCAENAKCYDYGRKIA